MEDGACLIEISVNDVLLQDTSYPSECADLDSAEVFMQYTCEVDDDELSAKYEKICII